MNFLVVVVFIVASQISAVSCADLRKELLQREAEEDALEGCDDYELLTDADRLENYFAPNMLKCDWQLKPGWYRFTGGAGTQMANKCMKTGSVACSAIGAGWVVGSNPGVDEGIVSRGVCFRTPDTCCSSTVDIRVRNCGKYIVYYLKGPERCPYRYCSTKPPEEVKGGVYNHMAERKNQFLTFLAWTFKDKYIECQNNWHYKGHTKFISCFADFSGKY